MKYSGRKLTSLPFHKLVSGSALVILASVSASSAAQQPSSNYLDTRTYIDDRSSTVSLLHSYYNAIARQEYLRAFSYIKHGAQPPTAEEFQKFADGYEHTVSVKVKIGEENGDGGAGTVWYCLPVALEATLDDGRKQVFSGYYHFMQESAADQQMWPFVPLMITKGDLQLSHRPFEESVPASCNPDP
ncbi:hypothetical protein [Phyllobacterium phragmitis]|uniref:hypothetical protein n=1 Tax=Phyllobacterium phragmitis TaxID=2670329 RepID=UPI0038B23027